MILYKRKKIRFIVSIAVLLFLPLFGNAATTEESEEEILFITSYNSDTKYTYDNISTFVETYTQLGGRYSTMVENMNATCLLYTSSRIFKMNSCFRIVSRSFYFNHFTQSETFVLYHLSGLYSCYRWRSGRGRCV